MEAELSLEFVRVVENAAIAADSLLMDGPRHLQYAPHQGGRVAIA